MPQPRVGRIAAGAPSKAELARRERFATLLGRGPKVGTIKDLAGILRDPHSRPGSLVDRPPSLDSAATRQSDGSRVRVVLAKVDTTDGGRAAGATASLFAQDGTTLLDTARVDRRGLVLLRFPQGTGADMGALKGKLRLGAAAFPVDVEVPAGAQHVLLLPAIDPGDVVGATGATVDGATDAVGSAVGDVADTGTTLEDAVGALEDAAQALTDAAAGATDAVEDAATSVTDAAETLTAAAAALAEAAAALSTAAATLAAETPIDSVVSRLPISFSPALADAVTRLLEVAEGPIPGIDSATTGISVSRAPLIKEMTVRRVVVDDGGKARRFLVRIRQEWYFIGFTLGELVRVDALDPASVTGTLDATLTARVQAGVTLDASTASRLQAALSGQLSAQAAIDSTLDVAVQARLDAKLKASAQAGIRNDPLDSFSSPGQFFGELGTSILDFALPDIGIDANADVNAALDVHAHTDLSIRSSLLAAARVNAAASLVNQARVRVTASLDAVTTVNAKLVAQVNPSLSRAVNLLRFVLYDVYAVTSRVEDVVEIVEQSVFTPPPPNTLLFPPADIVEYRPFFQRALLERQLAPHFGLLRRALADLRAGGEPIRAVQLLVEYTATGGGADLNIAIGGQRVTLRLRPGQPSVVGTIRLAPPTRPNDLTEARLTLTRRTDRPDWQFPFFPPPDTGVAEVTRMEIRYDGSAELDDLRLFASGEFRVAAGQETDTAVAALSPQPLDFDPSADSLVLHVNRNQHYYLGVLAEAAIRVPSLRQDAPQLAGVGVDSPLWRLPLLGFEADRALILVEASQGDAAVKKLVADEGTSSIVQLAAAGLYTEAAQGRLQIAEVAGLANPALAMAKPPLPEFTGLGILSDAGGLGAPQLGGALAAASPLLAQTPSLPNLSALASLLAAARPPDAPDT